ECCVGRQLAEIEEIQEVHYIAGDDGYLIKVRTRDTRQLGQLLRQKVLSIAGVTTTRTATVLETHKETAKIPIKREQGV
ncbi:MAG: AsnC family transcriptional regulator, partial [Desulfobulbus propionicus]